VPSARNRGKKQKTIQARLCGQGQKPQKSLLGRKLTKQLSRPDVKKTGKTSSREIQTLSSDTPQARNQNEKTRKKENGAFWKGGSGFSELLCLLCFVGNKGQRQGHQKKLLGVCSSYGGTNNRHDGDSIMQKSQTNRKKKR